jgi:Fe-S oxidoreductase
VKSSFPDFALKAALERIKEAQEAGAPVIISTCPFCAHNLKDAIQKSASPLKFYDLTELVLKALK